MTLAKGIKILHDQIKDDKIISDLNREAGKLYALSPGEIKKYEYLTGKEFIPTNVESILSKKNVNTFLYVKHSKHFWKQKKQRKKK